MIVGGALVIPAGLLAQRKGEPGWTRRCRGAGAHRADRHGGGDGGRAKPWGTRGRCLGANCGWDITSIPPARDGKLPPSRHIEVKGRAKGADTITVTRNEILYALNQADKFVLAIVLVDGDAL